LCGFTDGEGCFTASMLPKIPYRIRFILTQKHKINVTVLEQILILFNNNSPKPIGAVVPHSANEVYELRVNGIKNCEYLFNYFNNYTLKTKKKQSYEI